MNSSDFLSSRAQKNTFFSRLEQGNVPRALECLDTRTETESDRKWFNHYLIRSALERNCKNESQPSFFSFFNRPVIAQRTWHNFFSAICQQWSAKWEEHFRSKGDLLGHAIELDAVEAVEVVVDQLFSPEEINKPVIGSWTPLTFAILKNSSSSFHFLLGKSGIDLNAVDDSGQSPLSRAMERKQLSFLRELLNCGANPNQQLKIFDVE